MTTPWDCLNSQCMAAALAEAGQSGTAYRVLPSVASTNDELRRWARSGAPDWAVVAADSQTAGRGRRGRTWVSPPGRNLYLSFLTPAVPAPESWPRLPIVAAVAVVSTLTAAGVAVRLKWPNDIMAPSQDKLGGLLIEPVRSGTGPAVMGIGINVNAGEDRLPIGAASLAGITGRPWDRHRLAAELLAGCVHWWDRFLEEGFAPVARAWEGHALWLGEPVRVTGETGTVSGTMAGMDDWGRLRLQTAEGERRLTAGDVSLRRQ